MKPVDFQYVRVPTLEEAVRLLSESGGMGKVLAGGQSLVPLLNMRLAQPTVVVDINDVPGAASIEEQESEVRIGAMVRQRQAERSPETQRLLPLLAKALPAVGHVQIRNRGTVVGSIAHADPSAEIPLVALLLDAVLDVHGPNGMRSIPIGQFFYGYLMTALEPDEIITAVRFPNGALPFEGRRGTAFREMARREGDFALVAAACQIDLDDEARVLDVRLGLGGVAPAPVRLTGAEESLRGNQVSDELFREIAQTAALDLDPDEELHATADYRRHVARELMVQVLRSAAEEAAA